jgi:hypothetical protein
VHVQHRLAPTPLDTIHFPSENASMKTQQSSPLPKDVAADLRRAADCAVRGIRDPEAMRRACADMDRIREENRRLFGEQDIGVQIIREMRDSR